MAAAEERSLSEFSSALEILATTLLMVSTVDISSTSGYSTEKTTAIDLASAILGDFEFTQDLATNVKTIFGAINSIMVLSGTTVPSSDIGSNGQLYFKYSSSGGVDTVDGLYWKINNAWVEIQTGGGGGGASVTLGTTVPSDSTGSNGDLYVQYDGTTYAVIEYFVKINNSWRKSPYSRVVALTQAEYDLITPDTQTLYIITDAQSSYQTKQDSNLQTTADTIVGAINELNTASKFKVGDTITASIYKHCAGRLTNAGDKVLFFYPLEKPVDYENVTDALLTFSDNGLVYTANGGFSLVSGSYIGTITDGGIYFIIDLTQAQSSIGARPATVEFQGRTITFR